MHMADALISPAVGGTLWAVSGGLIAFCSRKVKQTLRENLVPMMGVLGAFIFASQMINFTIPGTGSSGHIGGGLILAILLGPHAAFLVIASVLTVQAFFFADGGLLALGCNMFNIGFFPAFVAYPLIYRVIARGQPGNLRVGVATIAASVVGLQLGAFAVVLQTLASGISELPFQTFVLMMLPIHLAIGAVEGFATVAVISFIAKARPEALPTSPLPGTAAGLRPILSGLAIATLLIGGAASWFASTHPDGLEWSIARVTGAESVDAPESGVHQQLAGLQEQTAFLPDYGFKPAEPTIVTTVPTGPEPDPWPSINAGTSISGIVGGVLTLILATLAGMALRTRTTPVAPHNV